MAKILLLALVIPIILAIIFLTSSTTRETTSVRINMELIREEMRIVDFGAVESIGAIKRDMLFISDDGYALFAQEMEQGKQERIKIRDSDIERMRAFIIDSGLLNIEEREFGSEDLQGEFVRYTLLIRVNNDEKRFKWVESSEFEPSDVPPLLIYLKDMAYCITNKAVLYNITCG